MDRDNLINAYMQQDHFKLNNAFLDIRYEEEAKKPVPQQVKHSHLKHGISKDWQ